MTPVVTKEIGTQVQATGLEILVTKSPFVLQNVLLGWFGGLPSTKALWN